MRRKGLLRYSADRRPLAYIVAIVGLSLVPFIIAMPTWLLVAYWFLLLYARSSAPYVQHNQGHLPVFRGRTLNWVYDILIAQTTGYATALWELHHVRGHHRHFLTPEKDVARITHLDSGEVMSRWWYALRGNLTIVGDSIRIARDEARAGGRDLLPKLSLEMAIQVVITFLLALWNPWLTLAFFVSQNLLMSWFIWWESYQHHLEVPMTNIYDASVTIFERWFNFQTFNLGHHSAHHEKPTLHWSLLPKRTEEILDRIPEVCRQENYQWLAKSAAENRLLWVRQLS